jgi:hypothetical protein
MAKKSKVGPTIKRIGGGKGRGKLPKDEPLKPVVFPVSVYRKFTYQSIVDSMRGK